MVLWIRSQNKELLVKVNELWVEDGEKFGNIKEGFDIANETHRFGRYKTKERALEILDEIQEVLMSPNIHIEEDATYYMPDDGSMKVYQMPKE